MVAKRRTGRTSGTSEGVDPIAGVHARKRSRTFRDAADRVDASAPVGPDELDDRERRQSRRRKPPGPDRSGTAPEPRRRSSDEPPPSDPAPPDPE